MNEKILSLKKDYDEKKNEIDSFFNFVKNLDDDNTKLKIVDMPVLKATCYLVLYNILEPTIDSLVSVVLDEANSYVNYNTVHKRIQDSWLNNQKDKIRNSSYENASDKLKTTIDRCLNNEKISISKEFFIKSNKVDANYGFLTICKIFECFNIKINCTKYIDKINNLCNKRNQLAHGEVRFCDVGSVAMVDLMDLKKDFYKFIEPLFNKTDEIISNKLYLCK